MTRQFKWYKKFDDAGDIQEVFDGEWLGSLDGHKFPNTEKPGP